MEKNNKKLIFNKWLAVFLIFVFLFSLGVKIHSMFSFPKISDRNYRQMEKVNKSKDNFSFAVFADNKNSVGTFDDLIKKVNDDKSISFSIDVGDLVYDGEKEKLRFFLNQIKNFKKPLLTAIGNHELRDNGRGNYYDVFGRFYYSFSVGPAYFIVLDDANERNLDLWQMDWLKKELEKSKLYKYRFVFMHVPLYDPRGGPYKLLGHSLKNLNFAKRLNNLFDEYNLTMLFTSHIHGYFKGIWQKTPYIITGGAGAELAGGGDPKHYFYHYIKVSVSKNGVSYKIIRLPSPKFGLVGNLIHSAWVYLYAFIAIHFIDIIMAIIAFYFLFYYLVNYYSKPEVE